MVNVVYAHPSQAALADRVASALGAGAAETLGDGSRLCAHIATGDAVVAVCAVPILVRKLAPLVAAGDAPKDGCGAVVALSSDGCFAVPVLGAHRAEPSANALATRVAEALDATAVVTTASEATLGVALDDLPAGWRLADPNQYKTFASKLLDDPRVRLDSPFPAPAWLMESRITVDAGAPLRLTIDVTDGTQRPRCDAADPIAGTLAVGPSGFAHDAASERRTGTAAVAQSVRGSGRAARGSPRHPAPPGDAAEAAPGVDGSKSPLAGGASLLVHPRALAVGVGCERGASGEALCELVMATLAEAGLARAAVGGVFSLDVKADEPAVHAVAEALGCEARFFDVDTLRAEDARLATPSEAVLAEVGCRGVAEGAALAAVGRDGWLSVAKQRGARTTCAIAQAPAPLDTARLGRARGVLTVLGTGPGNDAMFTPEARAAAGSATHLVGYRLYLDLLDALLGGFADSQQRHDYDLGEERDRVRHALALAAGGERVALVCSGDPGVYALATLAVEQLEASTDAAERRVDLTVLPGVSAAQAAAARAGAPLGHDFCFISLSDLLTPAEVIDARVRAAAEGDFVVAFYNPVSMRRRAPFDQALATLRAARPTDTPVVIARSLGRPEERVETVTLGDLAAEQIDMLTTVIIGSAKSRALMRGDGRTMMFTPRGYEV